MPLKQKTGLFFNNIIQVLFGLYFISVLNAGQDSYISFENASRYYNLLPQIINIGLEQPSSPLIISNNKSWNLVYFSPYSKLKTIKDSYGQGINKGTFIHFIKYENSADINDYNNLIIPLVMSIQDYKLYQLETQFQISFKQKIVELQPN